jgi:hypothetical protein
MDMQMSKGALRAAEKARQKKQETSRSEDEHS